MVREVTQAEVQAYMDFCQKHGIKLDGEDGIYNGNFVRDYFLNRWNGTIITEKTLTQAFSQLKPHLKLHTEEEIAFNEIYNTLTSGEQQAFAACKWPFGVIRNKFNAFVLLKCLKLHKFEVSEKNLSFAAGQGNVAGLLQWDEQAIRQKPKVESDPHHRPGMFVESSDAQRRREAEVKSAKAAATKPQLSADQRRWKQMADETLGRYRSHSQKEAFYQAYNDALATTNSYRAAYEAVSRVWRVYNPI